jgi:hypothetical protein
VYLEAPVRKVDGNDRADYAMLEAVAKPFVPALVIAFVQFKARGVIG